MLRLVLLESTREIPRSFLCRDRSQEERCRFETEIRLELVEAEIRVELVEN